MLNGNILATYIMVIKCIFYCVLVFESVWVWLGRGYFTMDGSIEITPLQWKRTQEEWPLPTTGTKTNAKSAEIGPAQHSCQSRLVVLLLIGSHLALPVSARQRCPQAPRSALQSTYVSTIEWWMGRPCTCTGGGTCTASAHGDGVGLYIDC